MKSLARFVSKLLLLGAVLTQLLVTQPVHAGVNDFVVHSFDATYTLSREDLQGKLTATEKIKLTFSDNNRGIERAIPAKYGKDKTDPKVISVKRDGASEPYTTSTQNGNLVLRIGRAESTLTGDHEYEISYSVVNVVKFFKDHDELYWDINGDQWLQPFESITAHFSPPADSPFAEKPAPKCYTGAYGSQEQACQFLPPSNATTNELTLTTTRILNRGETLTAVLAIPKGYFSSVPLWQVLLPYVPLALFACAAFALLLKALSKWRKYGKDYKPSPVVAPAFGPPRNFTPLLAGYLYEDGLLPKHISATIIDLAIRGYIKIVEEEKKKLFGKKTNRYLELRKSYEDLTPPEIEVMKSLFESSEVGDSIDIDTQKNKLYILLEPLGKKLSAEADKKGLYELSPESAGAILDSYIFVGAAMIFLSFILVKWLTIIAIVLAFAVTFAVVALRSLMTRRSHQGVADKSELEGLKLYLATAEKERLSALQSANAPLAANAKEPTRTVELFEKLLPYAILFDVEETWAEAFKDMYMTPPDWYQGNWSTFNTGVFIGSLTNSVGSVNSAFMSPSSSGGSGFGGGGGAGGGGGGGGGGGW